MDSIYLFSVILLALAVIAKLFATAGVNNQTNFALAQKNFKIMLARVNQRVEKGLCDEATEKVIKKDLVDTLNSTTLNNTQKITLLKQMEDKYPDVLAHILFV